MRAVAVLFLCALLRQATPQTMGPADVRLLYIEKCKEGNKINYTLSHKKINKDSIVMDLVVDNPYGIDDRISAKIEIAVQGNGGWKTNFYTLNLKDPCHFMRTKTPKFFAKLCKDSGVPTTCPMAKGVQKLNSMSLRLNELRLPEVLPYAKFRLTIKAFRDLHQFACSDLYAQVVPKKKVVFKKSQS